MFTCLFALFLPSLPRSPSTHLPLPLLILSLPPSSLSLLAYLPPLPPLSPSTLPPTPEPAGSVLAFLLARKPLLFTQVVCGMTEQKERVNKKSCYTYILQLQLQGPSCSLPGSVTIICNDLSTSAVLHLLSRSLPYPRPLASLTQFSSEPFSAPVFKSGSRQPLLGLITGYWASEHVACLPRRSREAFKTKGVLHGLLPCPPLLQQPLRGLIAIILSALAVIMSWLGTADKQIGSLWVIIHTLIGFCWPADGAGA